MDKKNTTIGAIFIVAAIGYIVWMAKNAPKPAPVDPNAIVAPASTAAGSTASSTPAPGAPAGSTTAAAGTTTTAPVEPTNALFASVHTDVPTATVTTLKNSFIEVHFTDSGGAIRNVAFIARDKKDVLVYPEDLSRTSPYIFNSHGEDPMLAFAEFPGLDRHTRFERVSATATEVVYRAVLDGRLEVTRRYTLPPDKSDTTDPYQIRHETTIRNLTDKTSVPMKVALALGTSAPTLSDPGVQLTTGLYTGSDAHFIKRMELESGSGFLGLGAHEAKSSVVTPGPVKWGAVKNQFFTAILAPDEPAAELITRRVKIDSHLPNEDLPNFGLTGRVQFDVKALAPNATAKIAGDFYVGPKEYARLAKPAVFKSDQDKIMDFGTYFGWASKLLLILMTWIHGFVGNWGAAIILTTLLLKFVFIPLTIKSARSMKRMAKLQPLVTAMREKYKDNPAKQQTAMMEIYKEHKVNPLGGCFPMLIPIPFFIGFFSMLQGTAELRFAHFLWVPDLSSTDTIATIAGFPIHLLPLLFTGATFLQMKMTPTPTVDNAQAKMMQFMPLIFLFIYYNMPAALSLYSSVNALFTIGQQYVINRMKDPEPAAVTVSPGGKVTKNVTPKKG